MADADDELDNMESIAEVKKDMLDVIDIEDEPVAAKKPETKSKSKSKSKAKGSATSDIPDGQVDAMRLYLSEIGFSQLLTAEEEVHYARLAQKGEISARQRMIE